jgi:hypothetical protein
MATQKTSISRRTGQSVRIGWNMSYCDPVMTSPTDLNIRFDHCWITITIQETDGELVTLGVEYPAFVEVKPR